MRKRNNQIVFCLTDIEFEHFQKQLEVSGLSKTSFLRRLIMGISIKPRLPDEYAKVVYEISKIGGNINQIAYRANASKYLVQEDAKTAAELMRKCWEHVQSLK